MIKTKKENIEIDSIDCVICDSCGESCTKEYGSEFMKLESSWGYDSGKDMEVWTAEICEKCVDEKFKFINFKVKNRINGRY